jgi:hypothetical protein
VCHADEFIVQPPFDPSFTTKNGKTAHIIHYTYGNDYDPQGNMVYGKGVSKFFHWDKRDYTYVYPPRQFPLPPAEARSPALSCFCRTSAHRRANPTERMADFSLVYCWQVKAGTVHALVAAINEATAGLKPWPLPGEPMDDGQ